MAGIGTQHLIVILALLFALAAALPPARPYYWLHIVATLLLCVALLVP